MNIVSKGPLFGHSIKPSNILGDDLHHDELGGGEKYPFLRRGSVSN